MGRVYRGHRRRPVIADARDTISDVRKHNVRRGRSLSPPNLPDVKTQIELKRRKRRRVAGPSN